MRVKNGLRPTPKDDRDLILGAFVTLPKLSELPDEFDLGTLGIKDQRDSDFCGEFAACAASELQEGVELCPEWAFAAAKKLQGGDPDSWGLDLRTAMAVHVKYGCPEAKDVEASITNTAIKKLRRIENYPPKLFDKAIEHMKRSYVKVEGPYTPFDDLRATLWYYSNEKRAAVSGVIFGWDTDDTHFDEIPEDGGGHAMMIRGWKGDYLIYQNSYGKGAGDNGVHYIHRDIVNHFVKMYGAYMFIDMPKEMIRDMIKNGIKDRDGYIIQLLKRTVTLLQQLLKKVAGI